MRLIKFRESARPAAVLGLIVLATTIRGEPATTNRNAEANRGIQSGAETAPQSSGQATNQVFDPAALMQKTQEARSICVAGRRRVCGLVLQAGPDGLVVDSGYTGLLRPELAHSWVVPATVSATRPENIIEENKPDAICVGLVFVTAIPKRPAVKPYDWVVLEVFPAGEHLYAPVPNVNKHIRKFSAELDTAIQLNLAAARK